MRRGIVVVGAGGHGKVVADILLAGGHAVLGFVDHGRPIGEVVMNLVVLGGSDWLRANPGPVALGVGDNPTRARIAQEGLELGCELVVAVHPRSVVAPSAVVEPGVAIMALAVVNAEALVRTGAIINTGAVIEHDCVVGKFAHISPRAVLGGGCRIGDHAHIGIGGVLLPRMEVGARTIVGGGAVVVRPLPADVIAVGVPARVLRPRESIGASPTER